MKCGKTIECYVEKTLDVIGGKRSLLIIKNLFEGTMRVGQIRKCLNNISPKTLTSCLRDLETQGIISRHVLPVIPPNVSYTLTEKAWI